MRKEQFAVYEIEPAHGSIKNGIILGPFATKEEAQSAGVKYGYSGDNYYVNSMSKERYNQIIDEAYENYVKQNDDTVGRCDLWTLKKEEFINSCKINPEFSEKWGLKIEERKLSLEERIDYWLSKDDFRFTGAIINEEDYESFGFPTKLITLTYNDEIIESYE